jgi:hypothetical protein
MKSKTIKTYKSKVVGKINEIENFQGLVNGKTPKSDYVIAHCGTFTFKIPAEDLSLFKVGQTVEVETIWRIK